MTQNKTDVQKKIDELVKNSDYFVASPDTIEQMKSDGYPIKSVTILYQEYLDKLFSKKRKEADNLIYKLPLLDQKIANGSVSFLYEELKECFVLGISGASIVLSILLLDLTSKFRLFEERKKTNPKASWKPIEKKYLKDVVIELRDKGVINDDEESELLNFNKNVRNNYLHYKIQNLIKGMVLTELPSVNLKTGKKTVELNVDPTNRPVLWFSAKKVLDMKTVVGKTTFCVDYVNKLMIRGNVAEKRL